jgi:hypothetical protein
MAAGMLLLAILACGFSASTANISNAFMTNDPESDEAITVFAQDEVFYAIAELDNAPDDSVIGAVWYVVEAEGVEEETMIDEAELTTGSGRITFNLTPDGLWPVGRYKVELYLNEELNQTLDFEVQ